ncbi:similar to Saccharomyces cerevisiae YGR266W Protein of unknown function, predicted to contain a single transmembrane domain [Maudiozyma saulgeensis]|uniref:PhoD-like phosphatase domain-containing protein n=1 Tax=Maudiozyma saulgeensis TaxID=1789683 RepID=A0A1X7R9P7_9SACH|nr:similar to Saccharomyces cerevisiae YGR266W Protein of unknown function, predicted to contain a single transmembrane domain [Kazachstania saulgeensis]
MNVNEWFDNWDIETLYGDKVKGSNTCVDGSPIPVSGIVCGPILRLIDIDYTNFLYNGSILIITKSTPNNPIENKPPIINYISGPANIDSLNDGNSLVLSDIAEFPSQLFHTDQLENGVFQFHRYSIQIPLMEQEQMIKYSLDGEFKLNYRFFIPSRSKNFNTIAYSCNGFSLSVDTKKFNGSLWFDILKKHSKIHYNVMLGGGDQIYSDQIKIYCTKVKNWLETKQLLTKSSTKVTPEFKKELDNFYLKEYLEWYGYGHWKGSTDDSKSTQRCFPLAMATIPSINIWDDHDIIDGFGSYSDTFMKTDVFSSIGKAAYKYYMLFQHQVSNDLNIDKEAYLNSSQWILGNIPGPYIGEVSHSLMTRLGPSMALLGLDCRTERKLKEILCDDTYIKIFNHLEQEVKKGKLDHLLVMLGVPIAYPRLVWLEWLFSSKLLAPLKYLSKKGIIAGGLVNEFNGDVELLDDLNDHWCARHHKKERNYLITKLQDFGAKHGIRITILSGDVHLASVGRFRSKLHRRHITGSKDETNKDILTKPEEDIRLMLNIISSAVVNTPPPDAMTKLLQSRAKLHTFDFETHEDTIPLFEYDVDGETKRHIDSFMNKRNWSDIIPVENVMANTYLKDMLDLNINDRVTPNIISKLKSNDDNTNEIRQKYPVTQKGVIASIHLEKDTTNSNSETAWYAIPIPELQRTEQNLTHRGIKHLLP